MNYELKNCNKKITFCTMCFDIGSDEFAQMRNDRERQNYEEYYLKPLLRLCKNFSNIVIYCDKKTEKYLASNLDKSKIDNIKIKVFHSFLKLKRFNELEEFKELTKNVFDYYPEYKNCFSLYSLNNSKTEYQAVYSLLVLSKIDIIYETYKENPFNTNYFAWIDAGCFQDKYSKVWNLWSNHLKINTHKFKCCVNLRQYYTMRDLEELSVAKLILCPTDTIEAVAAFFYIHQSYIEKFYTAYNLCISNLKQLHLPCTEQGVWTYMLQNGYYKLFYPIMCNDYNSVINLVATSKNKLTFSHQQSILVNIKKKGHFMTKKIFSVSKTCTHKVINLLGIKLKFRLKHRNLEFADIEKQFEYNLCKKLEKLFVKPQYIEQVEINLTSHCNLNCQMCDHFAPIAYKEFADINIVRKDLARLSELTNQKLDRLLLLGGEPLLHPDINLFIEAAYENFPNTEITIFTNNIIIDKMPESFWETCKKCNAIIKYTKYPINLDFPKLHKIAEEHQVKMVAAEYLEDKLKTSWKFPLDVEGKQSILSNFINCEHATNCLNLDNGKMYTCTVAPNIRHFNRYFNKNIPLTESDGVDIYAVKNQEELINRLYSPIPFCKYCDIRNRKRDIPWAISKKDIKEWT